MPKPLELASPHRHANQHQESSAGDAALRNGKAPCAQGPSGCDIEHSDQHLAAGGSNSERCRKISLYRVVLDAYEYHTLREMLMYLGYVGILIWALSLQWADSTPAFKSTIVESLLEHDCGDKWDNNRLDKQGSLEEVYSYSVAWLTCTSQKSTKAGFTEGLYVGEYVKVEYVAFVAVIAKAGDASCNQRSQAERKVECLPHSITGTPSGWTQINRTTMGSVLAPEDELAYFYFEVATLNTTNAELNALLERMLESTNYHFVAKYAVTFKMFLYSTNRISSQHMQAELSGEQESAVLVITAKVNAWTENLQVRVGTVNAKKGWMPITTCLLVAFWVCTLLYGMVFVERWRQCWHRLKFFFSFLGGFWNCFRLLQLLWSLAWLIWWLTLVPVTENPKDMIEFGNVMQTSNSYNFWLYDGIFTVLLTGLYLLHFMRVHLGLRAYLEMFREVAVYIADFAVVFLLVLLVWGAVLYFFFQISGGNTLFQQFGSSMAAIGRLTFGFLEYDRFNNQAAGMGIDWQWMPPTLFWCSVFLFFVYTQNTLLAIFNTAYENARHRCARCERTYLSTLILRLAFFAMLVGQTIWACPWVQKPSLAIGRLFCKRCRCCSAKADEESCVETSAAADIRQVESNSFLHCFCRLLKSLADDLETLKCNDMAPQDAQVDPTKAPLRLLFTRWRLVRRPEYRMLAWYYTDPITCSLDLTQPWLYHRAKRNLRMQPARVGSLLHVHAHGSQRSALARGVVPSGAQQPWQPLDDNPNCMVSEEELTIRLERAWRAHVDTHKKGIGTLARAVWHTRDWCVDPGRGRGVKVVTRNMLRHKFGTLDSAADEHNRVWPAVGVRADRALTASLEQLVDATMEVYQYVKQPMIDGNFDGRADSDETRELRAQLEAVMDSMLKVAVMDNTAVDVPKIEQLRTLMMDLLKKQEESEMAKYARVLRRW